ncbi:hypothetical protein MHBO_004249 [Bonamia ostreae]|uniref:Uncharacterized protein n=1 Tax=Bonamia ostreae TaxID=126728 RepID=A0ABV2ASS4_9EUKA
MLKRQFITKLLQLINDQSTNDAIDWCHDKKGSSLTRQLNNYQFSMKKYPDSIVWKHSSFNKNKQIQVITKKAKRGDYCDAYFSAECMRLILAGDEVKETTDKVVFVQTHYF